MKGRDPLQMGQNYFAAQSSLHLEFFDGTLRKIKVLINTSTRALAHTETRIFEMNHVYDGYIQSLISYIYERWNLVISINK